MTKYKKGYKVVQKYTLSSSAVIGYGSIKYIRNVWVKPVKNCGPLCVFDNLEHAERFNHYMLDSIYECFYEPTDPMRHSVYVENHSSYSLCYLPIGTVLATKVKLTKRVR